MTSSLYRIAGTAVLLVSLAVSPFAVAQEEAAEPEESSTANVLLVVRIGKLENGQRIPVKEYNLIVADGTPGSNLLSGQRVPFPGDEGHVYQNIGFSTHARAWILGPKTIKLVADIEDSRLREGERGAPIVETRQLGINAMLTDGVPLELTRVDGITDNSGFVEVEARILR